MSRRATPKANTAAREGEGTPVPLWRKALAELLGTAGLLCAVVGSGIMAERLAGQRHV